MWSFRWIETIGKDLQFTLRMIRKSPVFASVVILSLALAIGANTAIFSFVDAVLLKTLPVKNPEELVLFGVAGGEKTYVVDHSGNGYDDKKTGISYYSSLSIDMFQRMQQQNQTLSDLFAFAPIFTHLNLSVDNHADMATAQYVSGGYYKGLGVPAIIGRTIDDGDDKIGASPVAVITEHCWRERFNLDPSILGKPAFINGTPFTIVGVSKPDFRGTLDIGATADVSIPFSTESLLSRGPSEATRSWNWWIRIMGRLKPGVTIEQSRVSFERVVQQSAMEGLAAYLAKYPDPRMSDAVPPTLTAISGSHGEVFDRRDYATQLYVMLVIVGLVLAIACVNVANLLMARSGARQKEIAIRIALGAGRLRLIRQLLTESVALSVAGGAFGLVLAYWTKDILATITFQVWRSLKIEQSLDFRVLGFTAAISIATGILFGIAPALKATRIDPGPALKESASSRGSGRSWFSLGKGLVIFQVVLSVVLLVGAGLFIRTLRNLQHVDYGFDAQNMLLFSVNPSLNGYKGESLRNVYQQISDRIDAMPGVKSTTISLYPLMRGWGWQLGTPKVPGAKKVADPESRYYIFPVKNNFFDTFQIPLLMGRGFDASDTANSPQVAIVNQAFVKKVFDNDMPVGQYFQFDRRDGPPRVFQVAGVVKDIIYRDLKRAPDAIVYLPIEQQMTEIDRLAEGMTYEVRASGDPTALVPAIREAVRSVDGKLPILGIKTQTQQIDESIGRERVFAKLTGALGLLVLILAGLGLFGVMSYNVSRRTREIGIRMALGARAKAVLGNVMRETLVLVTIGIIFGIGVSFAATRFISSAVFGLNQNQTLLFGVSPRDPVSILLAALFLLAVAAIAGYLPARKASRVDPLIALRYD